MPIYEYECTQCGRVEEVMQHFSEKPLKTCRKCSGKLHKLISRSSFHLKGNGWYVTDYAGKSGADTAAQSDNKKKSDTGSPPDSSPKKKETKSDT
ncbi:MAG: FmdB family transcriptional regulator [Deltaproteobacteria bacterium SG8_13]|nr:MAG: FmdB family transcriptional regulator [Deltaproteobacteria bacterium SG8_13]